MSKPSFISEKKEQQFLANIVEAWDMGEKRSKKLEQDIAEKKLAAMQSFLALMCGEISQPTLSRPPTLRFRVAANGLYGTCSEYPWSIEDEVRDWLRACGISVVPDVRPRAHNYWELTITPEAIQRIREKLAQP